MTSLGARIHPTAIVAPNVELGSGTVVGPYAILGRAPRGKKEGELPLVIGADSVIRPFTTIYAGTTIGARLQTGQGASIREDNVIGDDVSVGTHASLEFGNRIGDNVRIHTGCFLELVTIEDGVFLGPHVVFTDDPHPQCPAYLDCVKGATVRRNARIGANSTLLPGVQIGEDALIGAGSVVRARNVPARSVWAGNPAVQLKEEITDLACFVGIYPHAYAWLEAKERHP
ncbi:MAG TPA: DapH/DapD/GlmU-related protein [Candidatus Limnocylindria bacterium]|nr:DapH/DapD/GlmU-related protein [Candidatus Limnocylindria bacterium]